MPPKEKREREPKFRAFFLTLNNWTQAEYESIQSWAPNTMWLLIGKEIAPTTGTRHLHICVYWKSQKTFDQMKDLNGRMNIKPTRAKDFGEQYTKKDDDWWEYGTKPNQGARNDLKEVTEEMKSGKRKVEDILMDDPGMYHMYGRTLEKVQDLLMRKKQRTWMTQGIWYYGETGVGKSRKAYEGYTPETHYVWKNDNGWQDGYTGQPIIIIDDFRGEIKYGELLKMVDRHQFYMPRRGREPVPCLATTVIVTSSMKPEEVYSNLAFNDSLAQLHRRFEVTEMVPEVLRG